MKRKLQIVVTVLCVGAMIVPAVATAQTAESQPEQPANELLFGLRMGMSVDQIESTTGADLAPVEGETYLYDAPEVPEPSPRFDIYGLLVTPEAGLCQIRALGVNVQTDPKGTELKQEFAELEEILAGHYGESQKTDELMTGSDLDGEENWMMSLLKNQRSYQAEWSAESGATLGDRLAHVGISARALNEQVGYVALQVSFANIGNCQAEIEAAEAEGR